MGIEETLKTIEEIVKKLDHKVDDILFRLNVLEAGKATPNAAPKTVSTAVEAQKDVEPEKESRSKCPKCGNTTYVEKEDKSKPMSQTGGFTLYAKVRYCKQCGTEFKN